MWLDETESGFWNTLWNFFTDSGKVPLSFYEYTVSNPSFRLSHPIIYFYLFLVGSLGFWLKKESKESPWRMGKCSVVVKKTTSYSISFFLLWLMKFMYMDVKCCFLQNKVVSKFIYGEFGTPGNLMLLCS